MLIDSCDRIGDRRTQQAAGAKKNVYYKKPATRAAEKAGAAALRAEMTQVFATHEAARRFYRK